jgi:hypothetical protein
MKGKFKLLGHIGLALFLVSALVLVVAPVAQAATAVTDVYVEFPFTDSINATSDTDGSNIYIVHFKPTAALVRGVDYVTVTFPDGTAAMCGTAASARAFTLATGSSTKLVQADVKFSTNYHTTDLIGGATWYQITDDPTIGGKRAKLRVPIDIAADTDVWIKFDDSDDGGAVQSGSVEASTYKVYVSTTKDTTPVLSSTFALGDSVVTATAMETSYPVPTTAGSTAEYIIKFKPAGTVTGTSGSVTVKFPVGTVLPSSISATNVQFGTDSSTYSPCSETPTVDQDRRTITAVPSVDLENGSNYRYIKILAGAGITNPTVADDSSGGGNYTVAVRTSTDGQWDASSAFSITAGSGSKVVVGNGEIGKAYGISSGAYYSDDATMVNMYSSQIYVCLADSNGNGITPSAATTLSLSSSSSTGTFAYNAAAAGTGAFTTGVTSTSIDATDGYDPYENPTTQIFYYKDSTAGTHTLTFSASGYTSATWEIAVCPAVSLYDSSDALINTYGPLSTDSVSETAATSYTQYYSGDYINSAITAAITGDTVKLGDGIYEQDDKITLDEAITLTSVNGASSTTLRPTTEALANPVDGVDMSVYVSTDGTSTNPISIDGLTFTRLRSGTEFDCAVHNDGYDYVTVQNCVFNYIDPDNSAPHEAVIWYRTQDSGNITSATVSNNTFTNCCPTWPKPSAGWPVNISFSTDSTTNTFSGITCSGNTMTNCNGYAITFTGCSGYRITGSITNNTLTNPYRGIYICDWTNLTTGASITGNTITDAYHTSIQVEGTNNGPITIKNNTITGCAVSSRGAVRIEHVQSTDSTYYYVYVQYNDIYNNSSPYGLYVDDNSDVTATTYTYIDCRYNYYGDASGPAYTAASGAKETKSNPNGTGDAISDRVFYHPWLYKSKADVVSDNVSYQTSTMKLVSGWNTLSTPVKLIDSANSLDELIPSGMTIGYYYDGGWQQITTGYTLSPCDAVYVKMSDATYVQIKFDAAAFSTPSKDLAAGWNLISMASLDSDGKKDKQVVASVYSTAANLPGYSQLVSPSINATQTGMYGNTGTSWTYSRDETTGVGTNTVYAGLGYWCYMQNAATLAGFEITPIAPDLD